VPLLVFFSLVHGVRGLKVIGAGLGRTGTMSMKEALSDLGLGPVYHTKELLFEGAGIPTRHHFELFAAAGRGERIKWANLFKGFQSSLDFPACLFWKEQLQAFPKAKVLLTVRSSGKKWYQSLNSTICRVYGNPAWYVPVLKAVVPVWTSQASMFDAVYWRLVYPLSPKTSNSSISGDEILARICSDEKYAIQTYEAWNQHVMANVPKQRLFVFEPGKTDYLELAAFLGVQAPSKPFPNVNSTREFEKLLLILRAIAGTVVLSPFIMIVLMVLCYSCLERCNRRVPPTVRSRSLSFLEDNLPSPRLASPRMAMPNTPRTPRGSLKIDSPRLPGTGRGLHRRNKSLSVI